MDYAQAKEKLEKYGQLHVIKYYDQLDEDQKALLLDQIEKTDFSVLKSRDWVEAHPPVRGEFSRLSSMELPEIEKRSEEFKKAGVEAIKAGKIGCVLLAGGMGTRLGSDHPKGMYDIGITKPKYIFQCLMENALEVVKEAGAYFHFYVMTSEKNHDETESFFKEKDYFGYDPSYVHFFVQDMAPASDYDGKVYMDSKWRISTSPNGNAGWYMSMVKCGLADAAKGAGVEYLNVFAVDNVLQKMADPVFVGATLTSGVACGAKVVKKAAPDERVGAICLEDGHPSIVEYYELTEDMMNARTPEGEPVYNYGVILNYLFRIKDLDDIMNNKLPLHVVEKKIPHMDENGQHVEPSTPNGYKYEQLVLDLIHELPDCLPFEVVREREFAPIKNPTGIDSVESARELLQKGGVVL